MSSLAESGIEIQKLRGTPGYFRLAQTREGVWWLLTPEDRLCFPAALVGGRSSQAARPPRDWGFDTVVARGPDDPEQSGVWQVRCAGLSEAGPRIRAGGALLPDVFDPTWRTQAAQRAASHCEPYRTDRGIVAWRSDDALSWAWDPPSGRPTLLQLCLSLEPSVAAYHAAWEFVLALHQGSFEAMATAWQTDLKNKDALRAWTQEERGIHSAAYLADHRLWSVQVARRYFTTASAILRETAPNHLRLSPRSELAIDPPWLAEVAAMECDVRSRTFSPADDGRGPDEAEGPVWIDGFTWAHPRLAGPALHDEADDDAPTRVERMLGRGRRAFGSMLGDARVVAWTWADASEGQWAQRDLTPRLVREDGSVAVEHTELLAWLNRRALKERIRHHG